MFPSPASNIKFEQTKNIAGRLSLELQRTTVSFLLGENEEQKVSEGTNVSP
jgi:hypothetical protein